MTHHGLHIRSPESTGAHTGPEKLTEQRRELLGIVVVVSVEFKQPCISGELSAWEIWMMVDGM